jgi:hypothetical protein
LRHCACVLCTYGLGYRSRIRLRTFDAMDGTNANMNSLVHKMGVVLGCALLGVCVFEALCRDGNPRTGRAALNPTDVTNAVQRRARHTCEC